MTKPIWGGVFGGQMDAEAQAFVVDNEQQQLDTLLLPFYLQETIAHVRMLAQQGIVLPTVGDALINALEALVQQSAAGEFVLDPLVGDVHENVEQYLIKLLGDSGKQVHTARSRNDQIETDTRLFLRAKLGLLLQSLSLVVEALLTLAEQHVETVMPGYTHMQPGQPMTVGYWLTSYATALVRDADRLKQTLGRVNSLALGAGASFGVPYAIDRAFVAKELGFDSIDGNGLDTISNRGELVVDTLHGLNLLWMHLGRFASELILFSTHEYGFVQVGEQFTSGSSIMPQKRNQDVLELMRAQSSIVAAEYQKCLSLLQKLPSGYQRDTRETKSGLLQVVKTTQALVLWAKLIPTIRFDAKRMLKSFDTNFATATDLADALVRDFQLPFRDAHEVVGEMVGEGTMQIANCKLKIEKMGKSVAIDSAWFARALDPLASVRRRDHVGGTAPEAVKQQIQNLKFAITVFMYQHHTTFGQIIVIRRRVRYRRR